MLISAVRPRSAILASADACASRSERVLLALFIFTCRIRGVFPTLDLTVQTDVLVKTRLTFVRK